MAERVPIWYDVHRGRSTSAETYGKFQKAAAELHRQLNLSVAVALAENDSAEIKCVASSGPAAPPIGTRASSKDGICAACVRQNRLQLSNDTAVDPMLSGELCARLGIRSILAVPLRRDSRCIGFVVAFSDVRHRFDPLLIERFRSEAARVEQHLKKESAATPNLSSRVISENLEFRVTAHVPIAAHARSLSIAALTCCALMIALVVPRAARSKTSVVRHRSAETVEQSLHVTQAEAANFRDSTNIKNSELRDLRQRADAGDVSAQMSLAARYEGGDGLERDSLKACVWYIIAGANGNLAAKDRAVHLSHRLPQFQIAEIRFNIGKMYMQGIGVEPDLVTSYSWFALAHAAGDVRAHDEQERLETAMSREQVSAGLRHASDWLLAHRSGVGQRPRELAGIPQSSR